MPLYGPEIGLSVDLLLTRPSTRRGRSPPIANSYFIQTEGLVP